MCARSNSISAIKARSLTDAQDADRVVCETVVIVNPASGGGRCGRAWPALERRLRAAGITFIATMTKQRGDGTTLARAALHAGATTIVAVGGDGTANEVINGFFAAGWLINPIARCGFIGAGTGNDLTRALGVESNAAIAALGPARHDWAASISCMSGLRCRMEQTGEQYAVLHVLMGVAGEGAAIQIRPGIKRLMRGGSYLLGGAIAALRHRPQQITYALDGGPPQPHRSMASRSPMAHIWVAGSPSRRAHGSMMAVSM